MALHNDLRWVDDELLEEEEAETSRPRLFRRKQKAESYGEREVIYVEKTKRKREKGIRQGCMQAHHSIYRKKSA